MTIFHKRKRISAEDSELIIGMEKIISSNNDIILKIKKENQINEELIEEIEEFLIPLSEYTTKTHFNDKIKNYYTKTEVNNYVNTLEEEIAANKITVDSTLSNTSTNPVQNKAINSALNNKAASNHTHDVASNTNDGFMSSEDKKKLDGLGGSGEYVLPTASATVLGGVKIGENLTIKDGVLSAIGGGSGSDYTLPTASSTILGGIKVGNNLTIKDGVLSGNYNIATSSNNGLMSSNDKKKLDGLGGSGSYTLPTASSTVLGGIKVGSNLNINNGVLSAVNTTYNTVTTSSNGLMTSNDKSKLDTIATGATKTTIDSSLSSTSTNPVQNKVINSALANKAASSHTHDDRYYTESEINTKLNGKANSSHAHSYVPSYADGSSLLRNDSYGKVMCYNYGNIRQLVWKLTNFTIKSRGNGWTVIVNNISDFDLPPGLDTLDIPIISHTGNTALLVFKDNILKAAYGSGSAENFQGTYMWST